MVVVVEGVDATGKSTLCKNLTQNLGGVIYATPSKILIEQRKKIDKFSGPQESFLFYSRGLEIASHEIKDLRKLHEYIFVDRYWISTVATHLALGAKVKISEMAKYENFRNITTVLLKVNTEKQVLRFSERGMTDGDRKLLKHFNEVQENFQNLVRKHCQFSLIIDTNSLSEKGVSDIVLNYLKRLKC